LNIAFCGSSKWATAHNSAGQKVKGNSMKKFLVPSLLALIVAGVAQRQANAGSFSIGISIGDDHRRHGPPPVIVAPPVVARPPVCAAQPPVVVVSRPQYCERGYYVRECERPYWYRHDRHWHGRYEPHRR
jgi:hypothetical protein